MLIPRDWDNIADMLAAKGGVAHALSLYHQGRDPPTKVMELIRQQGFHF